MRLRNSAILYRVNVWWMKRFSALAPQWQAGDPEEWENEEIFDSLSPEKKKEFLRGRKEYL